MDFAFDDQVRLIRRETSGLLATADIRTALERYHRHADVDEDARPLYRMLGRHGILAVDWATEYGGRDAGLVAAAAVAEELMAAGVPDTLHVNSIQIVGLFLLLSGSAEQKARYLPRLARGEAFAGVLYTEPQAGSDLSGITTEARRVSGGYRLSGTKVFSLKSHLVDLTLCAARTGGGASRYESLTVFILDMRAPGIRVRPLPAISDERFNEVTLDDVFVADEDVLGRPGEGFALLLRGLTIERTGLDYTTKARRWYEHALQALRDTEGESDAGAGRTEAGDALVEAGRHGADLVKSRLLSWQVISRLGEGRVDEVAAAMAKWYSGELAERVPQWAALEVSPSTAGDPLTARVLETAYRDAPGQTISAGTSEVMLQVVASARLAAG
ncbi:acyl-CoA dehydrogenase family protein [Streptomyces sp. G44]|uniref:acyl-CoA dehydrogenase family protein n=1 Tax=Streptomyces sp. G44 TaxID=2807632 RepID=UPI001961797A|nr:acyl-CoA dehydrogenase family protein [Streptomyces sp. G44]MBM7168894.1 acyl-CoA dehydrogenase family protein [Streptomyces sp. G44]